MVGDTETEDQDSLFDREASRAGNGSAPGMLGLSIGEIDCSEGFDSEWPWPLSAPDVAARLDVERLRPKPGALALTWEEPLLWPFALSLLRRGIDKPPELVLDASSLS